MKRIQAFLERLIFAGMKPGAPMPGGPKDPLRWLGPLRGPVDRFLSGTRSSDPLYLSNRTLRQKLLTGSVIVLPFGAVLTLLFLAAAGRFSTPPPQTKESPAVAINLPSFSDVQVKSNRELVVLEARVDPGARPVTLTGTAKNMTDRRIRTAEIIFEVNDRRGSQLGRQTVILENVEPQQIARFQVPVRARGAVIALVSEVNVQ